MPGGLCANPRSFGPSQPEKLNVDQASPKGPYRGFQHGVMTTVVAMIAVAAIACQFSLLRLAVPGAPSRAVMTGNAVLSLLDALSPGRSLTTGVGKRLKKTLKLVVGFASAALPDAASVSILGAWTWSIPVAFEGVAVLLR